MKVGSYLYQCFSGARKLVGRKGAMRDDLVRESGRSQNYADIWRILMGGGHIFISSAYVLVYWDEHGAYARVEQGARSTAESCGARWLSCVSVWYGPFICFVLIC